MLVLFSSLHWLPARGLYNYTAAAPWEKVSMRGAPLCTILPMCLIRMSML